MTQFGTRLRPLPHGNAQTAQQWNATQCNAFMM